MGQISSRYVSKPLYDRIVNEVKDLIYKYTFWTDDGVCEKLTLVYYDKLIQFKSSELMDASIAIGINYDEKPDKLIDKTELCSKIVNHYRLRVELLKDIRTSVDECYTKLSHATKGPVCRNVDKYISDFSVCQKVGGIWLNEDQYGKIVENLKKSDRYDEWKDHIVNLDKNWKTYLHRLQKIIKIVKNDIDNSLNNDAFTELKRYTYETIEKMYNITDIYYLLAVNFS